MNDLLLIASGAGLQDGLNPCVFMVCAVFIAQGRWLVLSPSFVRWLRIIFVLVYGTGILVFNFGPAQVFVLQKSFIFIAKVLYLILGAGCFLSGILFLKDWFLFRRGLFVQEDAGEEIKSPLGRAAICLAAIILAVILSSSAVLWPMNKYILILGNTGLLKGQWREVAPLLVVYVLIRMWPVWAVWAFLVIKKLQPSMLRIICASIFFTASSCVILMFK